MMLFRTELLSLDDLEEINSHVKDYALLNNVPNPNNKRW